MRDAHICLPRRQAGSRSLRSRTNMAKSKKILFLEKTLKAMAFLVLKKYQPKIIGVTGSVGKTSTKEAIFTVLASHYRVRRSEKNYNNEVGLPLTIIGVESGENSIRAWIYVFLKWLGIIIFPMKYPEILVLEMGADRPGDLKYLTGFIHPRIAVITDISMSHLEFFKTVENVAREKSTLVHKLDGKGVAILNIDNSHIKKIKDQLKTKVVTFGFSEESDIRASDAAFNYVNEENGRTLSWQNKKIKGLSFKLNYKGTSIPVRLNNILSRHNVQAALAGIAVGIEMGINLVEIGAALENFCLPFGRMNLIRGIKNSFIIDDTYNSSPVSAEAALEVLSEIEAGRKIAVMGDMLELGANTEPGHRSVAKKFLDIRGDIFFAVGERMKLAADELMKHNFNQDNLYVFPDPITAGKKLQEIMHPDDLILIKGSQGMRMEKVVEEVMEQPQKAGELLCRQSRHWKEKPWQKV
jgi:UDP-N-acetylmuramoyl-tripeptide--D-alanyl-D-alanine ligase